MKGVVPPPLIFGGALIVGILGQWFYPIRIIPIVPGRVLGFLVIALTFPIVFSAFREVRRAGTPFDFRKEASVLVTSGVYRYSRNPMYLSLALLLTGASLVAGSIWILLMVIPAIVLLRVLVIAREERLLEQRFGEEYRRYKAAVRRWL